jgi:hypothetical protein
MRPGPDKIIACPHCNSLSNHFTLRSSNTLGASLWTDGKLEAPMCPESPIIAKCWSCKKFYWLEDASYIGNSWDNACGQERTMPQDESGTRKKEQFAVYLLFSETRAGFTWDGREGRPIKKLSVDEYSEALTREMAHNRTKEIYLRKCIWWFDNDSFRVEKNHSDDVLLQNHENRMRLQSVLDARIERERLFKAEIARESGRFEQSMEILDSSFSDKYSDTAFFIKNLAENKVTRVRIIPQKPFLVPESAKQDYIEDPKSYVHRLYRGKEVRRLLKLPIKELTQHLINTVDEINADREREYQNELRDI